jgi:hypothetical protein
MTFPKLFGGTAGNTEFYTMDISSATSHIAIGGATWDSGVDSSASNSNFWPIVIKYDTTGTI